MTRQRKTPLPETRDERAPADRDAMIREAAYFHYERNGCVPGRELDDWLAAEAVVDRMLALQMPLAGPQPAGIELRMPVAEPRAASVERPRAPAASRTAAPRARRRAVRAADDLLPG